MNERLKEFLKKIHNPKNMIPLYISITIRPGKKVIDFKIKKEAANILKIMVHEDSKKGWFLSSIHIPVKNLGVSPELKNKEYLPILNTPSKIPQKETRGLMEEMVRKYLEILPEKKTHFFRTERFKKKKEFKIGAQKKGF